MNSEQYYVPPSQEIFEDIKQAAIQIWKSYDDTYGYATGKVNRIKDIGNVKDNWAYMVAMFDPINQNKLLRTLTREDSRELVTDVLEWSRSQY